MIPFAYTPPDTHLHILLMLLLIFSFFLYILRRYSVSFYFFFTHYQLLFFCLHYSILPGQTRPYFSRNYPTRHLHFCPLTQHYLHHTNAGKSSLRGHTTYYSSYSGSNIQHTQFVKRGEKNLTVSPWFNEKGLDSNKVILVLLNIFSTFKEN